MPNQLIHETSPYLLQHAENPVDWRPWSEDALAEARREDKPVFLSIGYAACHWCHVMAHESFEDPETARILNENFISIKVDREERPDLDGIYMEAVVALTGQGGWPMSLFLTPEGQPFYGGTYFPSVRRFGMPSFKEVLTSIANVWKEDRANVMEVAGQVTQRLQESAKWEARAAGEITPESLQTAAQRLIQSYDWRNGGWGQAPKFPQPMAIDFLLMQATRGDQKALDVAVHALKAMNRGGIYDLVGGGFHRYSTDNLWRVPHFEKMLYDNAQLALAYLHAYLLTGDASFRRTCERTLDFIHLEMMDPSGGFYSSLDADSEGEEGIFYVWTLEQLRQALGDPEDVALAQQAFQVRSEGTFDGKNVLQKQSQDEELAAALDMPVEHLQARLESIEQRLFAARSQRIRPATDDKVLVSWNALALRSFAEAARYLDRPDYLEIAQHNAAFLIAAIHPADRLLRSWRKGEARHTAYLEDYAALIVGLVALYQSDFDPRWYRLAVQFLDEMVSNYQDSNGGFYDTRAGQAGLLIRPKETQDNAIPSGNALAALVLQLLSSYSDQFDWQETASAMLATVKEAALQHPTSFAYWLQAMDFAAGPVRQAALVWPKGDESHTAFLDRLWSSYRPRTLAAGSAYPPPEGSPALLQNRPVRENQPTAYVCYGFACRRPVTSAQDFEVELAAPVEEG